MNSFSNQTSFTTVSPDVLPSPGLHCTKGVTQSMASEDVASKTVWPASNVHEKCDHAHFMVHSEHTAAQSSELIGSKSLHRRPTTAGQLLDNLADIND